MTSLSRDFLVGSVCFLFGFGGFAALGSISARDHASNTEFDLGLVPAGRELFAVARVWVPESRTADGNVPVKASCGCVSVDDISVPESGAGVATLRLKIDPGFAGDRFASEIRLGGNHEPSLIVTGGVIPLFDGWPAEAIVRDGVVAVHDVYTKRLREAFVIGRDGSSQMVEIKEHDGEKVLLISSVESTGSSLLALYFDDHETAQWSGPLVVSETVSAQEIER